MDRRTYLSGTVVGITAATAGCMETFDSVRDSFGVEEADVSSTVSGRPESVEFEAESGDDIVVTVRVEEEGTGTSGDLEMADPDGTTVANARVSGPADTIEEHTAEQTGTYQVTVDPNNDRLRLSVSVQSDE